MGKMLYFDWELFWLGGRALTSKNIDSLSHLVCFIITVNGSSNKKRKEKKKLTLGRLALVAGT
jgi:hypothetical protein